MTQQDVILKLQEENHLLRQRNHNLESDLSYHVKKERVMEEKTRQLLKGAISTEYGAFIGLAEEVLYRLDIGTDKDNLQKHCISKLRKYLGTHKVLGALAKEINHEFFGLVEAMLTDYPQFGPFEVNLYCCMVINVRDSIIREVFELGTPEKTARAKHDLRQDIWALRSKRRVKYMKLLEKKDCTYGKKLLSLHDLKKFPNGKPEKNKD